MATTMPKVNFSPCKNKSIFVGIAGTKKKNVQKEVKIIMYKGSKKVLIYLFGNFLYLDLLKTKIRPDECVYNAVSVLLISKH